MPQSNQQIFYRFTIQNRSVIKAIENNYEENSKKLSEKNTINLG